jgi:D-alanine--poly(phosphoribitol) ligase subunit 2
VAVEQKIEDKFGFAVALADEKALSQRQSPFRTVRSLADYAAGLIERERGDG